MAINPPTFGEQEPEAQTAPPIPTFGQAEAATPAPVLAPTFSESIEDTLDSEAVEPRIIDGLIAADSGSFGERLAQFKQGIVDRGQLVKGLFQLTAPTETSGKLTGQVIEEAGRLSSSQIEAVGKLVGDLTGTDEGRNLIFQAGNSLREASRTPDEQLAEEKLWEQFSRGLIQTGAFFLGGKAISEGFKKGPKTAGAIAAWLGASVGGQAGREDALRHGAEPWQVDTAFYLNSAFGLSEGLPIGGLLGRIDDMTGGVFSKRFGGVAGELTRSTVRGILDEGMQEAFQTFGENLTAADIAGYDPERPLMDNIEQAAAMGGSIGGLLSLAGAALGIRNRSRLEAKLKEEVLDPLGANSLDEIAGPLVVLDDRYQNLLRARGRVDAAIAEQARPDEGTALQFREDAMNASNELVQNEGVNTTAMLSGLGNASSQLGTQADMRSAFSVITRKDLEGIGVTQEIEGDKTIVQRISETPVVAAFSYQRDWLENSIREREATEQDFAGRETLTAEQQASRERNLQNLRVNRALLAEQVKIGRAMKNLFSELRPLIGADSRFILTDTRTNGDGPNSAGSYHTITLPNVRKAGEQLNADVIFLNIEEYMEAFGSLEAVKARKADPAVIARHETTLQNRRNQLLQAALHEFSHGYAFAKFHEMARKIEAGTATQEEQDIFQALTNDYYQHVSDVLAAPDYLSAIEKIESLPRAMRHVEARAGQVGNVGVRDFLLGKGKVDDVQPDFRNSLLGNITLREDSRRINYLLSMSEFMAEHMASSLMNDRTLLNANSNKFFTSSIKDIRKGLAIAKGRFAQDAPTLNSLVKQMSLRRRITEAGENLQKNVETNPIRALAKEGIVDSAMLKNMEPEELDRFNKLMDVGFTILQIAEQNPHIAGLQNYVRHLREWKNDVNNNLAIAEDRLKEWKALGSKENEQLSRALLDETIGRKPDGGWLSEPRPFTNEELAEYGLSDKALELRQKIKQDFQRVLDQMEAVLIASKERIFAENEVERTREVLRVQQEFADMRKRPYFPLMRFGEFLYQVRANGDQTIDGKRYKDGEIVEFQTFDTKQERDRAVGQAKKQFVPDQVQFSSSAMVTPNFSLQGMPMTLIEHLESKLQSTELDEQTREAIRQVKNDILPFKSFRKQFQRRKRILGFSPDAQRAYANYMSSFANHIARVKFDSEFKKDFENVEDSIKVINKKADGDSTKRAQILNHMNSHLQYVMNPVNEFVWIRSATFFWFLGFNVKSAFVNLTQIPLVTYPYLAARFGDSRAVAQLTRANGTAIRALTRPDSVNPDLMQMIEQGMNESWLDESLATELALAAGEKNLGKSLPRKLRQKAALKISHYGSLPFHVAEKFNRHVTAIAAYRLARNQKIGHEGAVEQARLAVEKTQFEYARWARPRFMRGPVGGTLFVFQSYLQNALYFALGGDPGAFRMMMMLLLVAGLQGLPFGENIMDLVDAGMTALKKKTGVKDPQVQVRKDLRELLKELSIDPDLALHGLSSSTFGFANIGEFMGWPIPDMDLSGSLSMGRVIPGTELLAPGQTNDFDQLMGRAVERTGGAAVSAMAGVGKALLDNHPDQWKRWERVMPAAMRSISKAARFRVRGGEFTRGGDPIAEFDLQDTRDHAEVILQGLGFTPRDVSKGWEGFIAKQQSVIFYETWKSSVLRQWNYARFNNLEDAVREANEEIRAYNKMVPFPEMKIGPKTRRSSYKTYVTGQDAAAAGVEQRKAFRRLSSSVEAVFEDDGS